MTPAQPADSAPVATTLRTHLDLCQEILDLVLRENQALRAPGDQPAGDFHQRRKNLLPRLQQSLTALRVQRVAWQQFQADSRAPHREITALLRSNQDLVMKIIVLDRENEQALLRRGLVPPRHLPPAQRQQPHFVANLYRRHSPR